MQEDTLTLYQKMKLKKPEQAEPDDFENQYSLQSIAGRLALLCMLFLFLAIAVPEMRVFGTASVAGLFLFLTCYGFFQIKNGK